MSTNAKVYLIVIAIFLGISALTMLAFSGPCFKRIYDPWRPHIRRSRPSPDVEAGGAAADAKTAKAAKVERPEKRDTFHHLLHRCLWYIAYSGSPWQPSSYPRFPKGI